MNVSQLIKNSVLIESEPNHKSKEKHAAARYHHFYLPIKVKDKLYTVHIVGEQLKDSIGYTPIDVKLYDVIVAKKGTSSTATRSDLKVKNVPFTITISEMLQNVKDSHNQPFINKDGTLSQGINFYANNDSNYHQTVEEPTGKKDLIAYHNISQDNLDKAIQLGGLAIPSITVTNKETDYINFGNITLLMPQDVVNPKETPVYTRDAWTGGVPRSYRRYRQKENRSLGRHKNTLNEAGLKEDIMAKVLLSEDAYEKAHKPTVEALMQSNGNVQGAAKDSALIYVRMIDSLARKYKLPVENIVATIHTNEGFQNGMYGLPAHNVRADGITDIGGYYEEIKKRMSGNNEKLKNVSKITYSTPDGLLIQGERLVHICKKHGFSTEELMDMERHINSIYNPTVSERYRNGQKGQFGGISVYGLIKGDKDNYFVVISFLENGTIRLETAVKDKDANTYKNKMELSHPLQLTDNAAAQQGNDNSPISIGNIQKILGIVKKKNYYQQAEGYTGKT